MMSVFAFPAYAFAHLTIFILCIGWVRNYRAPGAGIIAMIAAGLVYDNAIVSLGASIGAGTLLQMLSWPRFALHALLTPFMMLAALQVAGAAGISWARNSRVRTVTWIVVALLVGMGAWDHLIGLETVPACFDGIVRYTENLHPSHFCSPDDVVKMGSGPPIPSILGNLLTLVAGFAIWRSAGWPWLMLGALVMFAAAAVPIGGFGMVPSNGGEVVLMAAYAATIWRFKQPLKPA
jgi:hypothetical protein